MKSMQEQLDTIKTYIDDVNSLAKHHNEIAKVAEEIVDNYQLPESDYDIERIKI